MFFGDDDRISKTNPSQSDPGGCSELDESAFYDYLINVIAFPIYRDT